MEIYFEKNVIKKLKFYKKKESYRYKRIMNRISLFKSNIHHPSLRTHKLTGKIQEYWRFWIEGDLRMIYGYKDKIVLIDIRSHSEVYK